MACNEVLTPATKTTPIRLLKLSSPKIFKPSYLVQKCFNHPPTFPITTHLKHGMMNLCIPSNKKDIFS